MLHYNHTDHYKDIKLTGIADTGRTTHIDPPNKLEGQNITEKPITVSIPDGTKYSSTNEASLGISNLSKQANKNHTIW